MLRFKKDKKNTNRFFSKYKAQSKYRNKPVEIDGIVFDSLKEGKRYKELKLLEKAGYIFHLELQPEFVLSIHGEQICKYRADFAYNDSEDEYSKKYIVEDVKGMKTQVYKLKKKLMKAIYGIDIKEV
ncbi:MAG: DUF1064 domain-containing protein [Gammaproteobacteria bacterium]|nr:DUF1064 domain-containing protein [Gammaproteobacteria bacterium]